MHIVNKYNRIHSGFTLVETLVAISILLVVVTSTLTVTVRGLQSAFYANDRVTAVYLAQETIESVERLRDENALNVFYDLGETDTWDFMDNNGPLGDCFQTSQGCDFDISGGGYIDCGSNQTNCKLYYDETGTNNGYFYSYDIGGSAVESPFTRHMIITKHANPASAEITVTVSWNATLFSNNQKSVVLKSWLYDHYNRYED